MMRVEKKLEIASRIEAGEGVSAKEHATNPQRAPFARKRRPSRNMHLQQSKP
jgi:hypothetical protein